MKPEIRKYYYHNGDIQKIYYYVDNKLHREDGPAIIRYYENGNIQYEEYYLYNKLHREDGPAVINYYYNGSIEYYCLNNEYLNQSEWLIHCRKRKLKTLK